jgi:hypothetical protein
MTNQNPVMLQLPGNFSDNGMNTRGMPLAKYYSGLRAFSNLWEFSQAAQAVPSAGDMYPELSVPRLFPFPSAGGAPGSS